MENIIKVSSTKSLKEAIEYYLKELKEKGAYIADRSLYLRYGSIFKDGMNAYSEYDLFVERVYKPKFVKTLDKEISHYSKEDMEKLNTYSEKMTFITNVAELVVEAEAEEVEKAKEIVKSIEEEIPNMQPVTDNVELPFFINNITEEEIPLITMRKITDEAVEEWAEKLAMFVECYKSIVTPVQMSDASNKDGLTVAIVNNIYWYDIIVR